MRLYKSVVFFLAAVLGFGFFSTAQADKLMERVEEGKPIRIGYANEVPWAYPGENNEPLGFVNVITLDILERMGYTEIEQVVTDWGGLIPGLKANRYDIITGGMYILKNRCENIAFSEPIGVFGDAFIVPKGNPMGIETYKDVIAKGAVMVTASGYNTVDHARKQGVPERQIMQVPGPTEILAAVTAGRADCGILTYFTAQTLKSKAGGAIDVTDPRALPDWTFNWVGIGFRHSDTEFLKKFNEVLEDYLGSEAMLESVKPYRYTESQLPGDVETDWICKNR